MSELDGHKSARLYGTTGNCCPLAFFSFAITLVLTRFVALIKFFARIPSCGQVSEAVAVCSPFEENLSPPERILAGV